MTTTRCWTARVLLVAALLALGAAACRKEHDRLLLLDVRASGALDAPVASVRFSAAGWPTRTIASASTPGAQALLFGYYGPTGSGAVTVTAEALDANLCVVADGAVTVLDTTPGMTSAATVLYLRPRDASGCGPIDSGTDAGPDDAGADGDAPDAGADGADAAADAIDAARADGGGGDADAATTSDASDASDASDGANVGDASGG